MQAPVTTTIRKLRTAYPAARCALGHASPLQLLVATILSAQCTDERVNMVTPPLFARYPDVHAFAGAKISQFESMVHSTGFYRSKARHIQAASRQIIAQYGGEVPREMDNLLSLPGVARKTANVVRAEAFGIATGVVVDTHVRRISQRLHWTSHTDPVKIEQDLIQLIPKRHWLDISHLLIFHGRAICTARNPECNHCPLARLCPSAQLTNANARPATSPNAKRKLTNQKAKK